MATKAARPAVTLRYLRVDKVMRDTRSNSDQRRRVDIHVLAFEGSDGETYLKPFETARGQQPALSTETEWTHDALNRLKIQWR